MAALRLVLTRENSRRDKAQGLNNGQDNVAWNADEQPALHDQTDCKNKDFRYLL
jgi:hypothetical protein